MRILVRIGECVESVIRYIVILLLTFLSLLCLIFETRISMDYNEIVHIEQSNTLMIIVILCLSVLLAGLLSFIKSVEWITEIKLFWLLSTAYTVVYSALILCADTAIRADQESVFRYAVSFNSGDYSGLFPDRYLGWYPYQLGIVTWERILLYFHQSTRTIFFINLFLALGICFIQWQISKLLFRDAGTSRITIILSFLFLPHFFYVLHAYGQIPGLFFCELAVLCFCVWKNSFEIKWVVIGVCSLATATLLKPNYLIATIAISIVLLMSGIRYRSWKYLVVVISIVFVAAFTRRTLYKYYESVSGIQVNDGIPISSVFSMGLQHSNKTNANGWDNTYSVDLYYENDCDSYRTHIAAMADLKKEIYMLSNNPKYAFAFFGEKIISTWCDPLYESIWIGPLPNGGQKVRGKPLRDLYRGEGCYNALAVLMNTVVVVIMAFSALFLIIVPEDKLNDIITLFFGINLVGGFLYHLASETSSQYVYMYVFMMIPTASSCLAWINIKDIQE